MQINIGGARTATLRVGGASTLVTRPSLIVSQAEVERSLRNRLARLGATVEWSRELVSFAQDASHVSAGIAGVGPVDCDWLIGCDGAHSRVRHLAGIGFTGGPIIEEFLLADAQAALPADRGAAHVWARTPAAGANGMAADPGRAGELDLDVPHPAAARATYRAGRVFVAGDAAHIHSPFGGQGMNTGLGDADNLAWKLALVVRGAARTELLDKYEAERRPVARDVLRSTTSLTRAVPGDTWTARFLRDHVLIPALDLRPVQRLIAERSSQLRVNYRHDPLFAEQTRRRPVDKPALVALRAGIAAAHGQVYVEGREELYERTRLMFTTPALRAHFADGLFATERLVSEALAPEVERPPALSRSSCGPRSCPI